MWLKWFPWRFLVRQLARQHGFLDPFTALAQLRRFSQPSEVLAPTELLRAGAILQFRGIINSQAIQHNLDWVWPYWAEEQFHPKGKSFIPRAFNISHINLTHRDWTGVGLPGVEEIPIVDPRGLVTPHFDGWSLDAWIVDESGGELVPARAKAASQKLLFENGLSVLSRTEKDALSLETTATVELKKEEICLEWKVKGSARHHAWLVLALRPSNPEGVSFVHKIEKKLSGWRVNGKDDIRFHEAPEKEKFSAYKGGDVFARLLTGEGEDSYLKCEVGMATGAAMYSLPETGSREVRVTVPLRVKHSAAIGNGHSKRETWHDALRGKASLSVPDKRFEFLYEAALRTLVLHSPGDVFPGPYTYKRFWFRDAAFILHALIVSGLSGRARAALDLFPSRQTPFGYFLSQDGEWDSNGEALWILDRYCKLTGEPPDPKWRGSVSRAGKWIVKKRLKEDGSLHSGLLPPGFSAEHLGPNDYYYWDDFWSVSGLRAAASLMRAFGDEREAREFAAEADSLLEATERSIRLATSDFKTAAVPASPYRRLDAGSIGSIAAGYPLELWPERDIRLLDTADFLIKKCFLDGAFYQEISHSGINAYLTLHVAQILLRSGDARFFSIVERIAELASATGQWPEAIHPFSGGGCMGDGQHVWAAAEWVLMIRNMFIREETGKLVIGSGIPRTWLVRGGSLKFGPAPTDFGPVTVSLNVDEEAAHVAWHGEWRSVPEIDVALPGFAPHAVKAGALKAVVKYRG